MSNDDRRCRYVRELAVKSLRRRGVAVRPGPHDAPGDDQFVDDSGNLYWLHNLQIQCSGLRLDQIPDAVEFSFDQRFAARDEPSFADLPDAEVFAQVRTRLQPPNNTGLISTDYARPVFDGLVAELSRDLPTAVHTVGDRDVYGRDVDFLYEVGQRNTDAEPATAQHLPDDVVALHGQSFFIASKALNMPNLISSVLGTAPLGVVFSVPHRSLLLLHRVGPSTVAALTVLTSLTVRQTEKPPGGVISRTAYHWYGGSVQPVSRVDPATQQIQILVDGTFADALERATTG